MAKQNKNDRPLTKKRRSYSQKGRRGNLSQFSTILWPSVSHLSHRKWSAGCPFPAAGRLTKVGESLDSEDWTIDGLAKGSMGNFSVLEFFLSHVPFRVPWAVTITLMFVIIHHVRSLLSPKIRGISNYFESLCSCSSDSNCEMELMITWRFVGKVYLSGPERGWTLSNHDVSRHQQRH